MVRGRRVPGARRRRGGAPNLTIGPDFTLEEIRVRDLDEYARRVLGGARDGDLVPLTQQRALAYSRNPYAGEADVGLIVAHQGGRCAGYLGIMPGRILVDGTLHPVHWFSTWFVPPEFRNAGVGLRLILAALALKRDLVVTGTSPEADRIYRGLGFREIGPLVFRRLRLPLPAGLRRLLYGNLLRFHARTLREFEVREVSRVGGESPSATTGQRSRPRFVRGAPVVNWMLAHPWVLERHDAGGPSGRYAFSDTRAMFRYVALELRAARSGEPRGYVVLSVSSEAARTTVKVLDYEAPAATDLACLFPLALRYARLHGADGVDLPREACESGRTGLLAAPLVGTERRAYFCRPRDPESPLARALPDLQMDYCDGDSAFV